MTEANVINDQGLAEQLTIIVPTYNRPKSVKKVLQYIRNSFVGPIIVADSSPAPIEDENRAAIETFKDTAIQYLAFPEETTLLYKFSRTVEHVETKYALFCGDDDFIVPAAAIEAVGILESTPSIRSVNGRALHLHFNQNRSLSITNYRQRSCMAENWLDRLESYVRPYSTTFYAVQSTDDLNATFNALEKNDIKLRFAEMFAAFTNVARGKVHRLDKLFLIRGSNEPNRASAIIEKFWYYIFNPEFPGALKNCAEGIINYAENVHGELGSDAKDRVKKVISDMLAINHMCGPDERHQIPALEDDSANQLQWMERFSDPTHPDTMILKDIADQYVSTYQ